MNLRHRINQLTHNAAGGKFVLQTSAQRKKIDPAIAQEALRNLDQILALTTLLSVTDSMLGGWLNLMSVYVHGVDWVSGDSVRVFNQRWRENPMPDVTVLDASQTGDIVDNVG